MLQSLLLAKVSLSAILESLESSVSASSPDGICLVADALGGLQWERALKMLDDMQQQDILPNVVSFSATLGSSATLGVTGWPLTMIVASLPSAIHTVDIALSFREPTIRSIREYERIDHITLAFPQVKPFTISHDTD
jgi:hypothetical protein